MTGTGSPKGNRHLGTRVAGPVAVGAVLLAGLQVLQSAINSFNPKVGVTVLLAVAGGLATFAANRYRTRGQEALLRQERTQALQRGLRDWPLRQPIESDPYRLGVFPPRRDDHRLSPLSQYVARAVDPHLCEALEEPGVVVVFGPPRAGKSRTAFEAVQKVHKDSKLIAPADDAGLQQVLDLELTAPDGDNGGSVLWLDGLERFIPVIDGASLERWERDGATVVATIRTNDYDALLGASGPEGEAGKAIAARGRAFEVADQLTPAELPGAKDLYDGLDFDGGFGAALSGTGKEEASPGIAPPPAQSSGHESHDPWHRDRQLLGSAAGSALALLALGVVALTVGIPKSPPLSLGEQVDKIKSGATGSTRQLLASGMANFHGFGNPSYWFAFGPSEEDTQKALGANAPLPADEIVIYDQRGGKLRKAFSFQPETPAARFKVRYDKDLDGDGEAELIGGYGFANQISEALMPVVVHWASGTRRYRITSLQTTPPDLQGGARPTTDGRPYVDGYQEPVTLRDGNVRVTGYRMQTFLVTKNPRLLIRGLTMKPKTRSLTGQVQVQASVIRIGDQPTLIPCRLGTAAPPAAKWRPGQDLQYSIEDAWNRHARNERCVP